MRVMNDKRPIGYGESDTDARGPTRDVHDKDASDSQMYMKAKPIPSSSKIRDGGIGGDTVCPFDHNKPMMSGVAYGGYELVSMACRGVEALRLGESS